MIARAKKGHRDPQNNIHGDLYQLINHQTNQPTPSCSTVPLEELIIYYLVYNPFYGTQRFIHENPPFVPIVSQFHPLHSIQFYFFKFIFNIILQFLPMYSTQYFLQFFHLKLFFLSFFLSFCLAYSVTHFMAQSPS
jgi:hypothetical protein